MALGREDGADLGQLCFNVTFARRADHLVDGVALIRNHPFNSVIEKALSLNAVDQALGTAEVESLVFINRVQSVRLSQAGMAAGVTGSDLTVGAAAWRLGLPQPSRDCATTSSPCSPCRPPSRLRWCWHPYLLPNRQTGHRPTSGGHRPSGCSHQALARTRSSPDRL